MLGFFFPLDHRLLLLLFVYRQNKMFLLVAVWYMLVSSYVFTVLECQCVAHEGSDF